VQASFTGREVAGLATLEGISETAAIVKWFCRFDKQCQCQNGGYIHVHVFEVEVKETMTKVRLQCNAGAESFLIRTPTLTLFQHHVSDLTVIVSRSRVGPMVLEPKEVANRWKMRK
jgi:hypothetical protein